MRRKKQSIFSKIARDLDFPSDMYSGGFRCEVFSDNEAAIYGVRGICDYTPQMIVLAHKRGKLVFVGDSLMCDSYVEGVVCIRGRIAEMRFE